MKRFYMIIFLFITPSLTSIDSLDNVGKELLPSQRIMHSEINKLDALSAKLDELERE